MADTILQVGTAEVPLDLEPDELVLSVLVVIETAPVDQPGRTRLRVRVPEDQNFLRTLGLTRYAALEADDEALHPSDDGDDSD